MQNAILAGYEADAADLIEKYESVSCETLFAPVSDFWSGRAGRLLDIGAGTGRNAAHFANLGYRVLAVEPTPSLRAFGVRRHAHEAIEWLDDRLPELKRLGERAARFDLLLICAVWQHLDEAEREEALPRLTERALPGGRIVISLRRGPGAPNRPVFALDPDAEEARLKRCGWRILRRCESESIQADNRAAGVRWTWLVGERP